MGKVVKFCSACDEGFAEKFGFCPNCGAHLTAFEMNPLENTPAEEAKTEPVETIEAAMPPIIETPAETEIPHISETRSFSADAPQNEPAETKEFFEFSNEIFEEPVPETQTFHTAETSANENLNDNLFEATYAKSTDEFVKSPAPHYIAETGYQPTIVVEKNVKERNTLLLGAFVLACMVLSGSYVYSMFNKFLDIAAIDTPSLLSYVGEVDPTQMELEEPPKKEKDNGGGGGGGGRDEQNPVSKGREATQVDKPLFSPSISYTQVTKPTIAIQAATEGNRQAEKTNEPYGLRNGGNIPSDGDGTGGGQGSGRGTGQGSGQGTGLGTGNGSGFGGGNGNGNGDGSGDGDGDRIQVKKPPVPVGPTEGVKILSKPRANYTDAARQNQVQGKVVLRVTFAANGSISNIAVISGLGNGLTEQAIAAARGIRFEPAKRGGVAYSVTKPVEYTFTIY